MPALGVALLWVFLVGFAGVRFTDFLGQGEEILGSGTGVSSILPYTIEMLPSLGVLPQELSCSIKGESGVVVPIDEFRSLVSELSRPMIFFE